MIYSSIMGIFFWKGSMDVLIQTIISTYIANSLQLIIIPSLVIACIVLGLRKIIENLWPGIVKNNHYENLFLPVSPYLVGLVLFFLKSVFTLSFANYMIAAGVSSFTFRLAKQYISVLIQKETDDSQKNQEPPKF